MWYLEVSQFVWSHVEVNVLSELFPGQFINSEASLTRFFTLIKRSLSKLSHWSMSCLVGATLEMVARVRPLVCPEYPKMAASFVLRFLSWIWISRPERWLPPRSPQVQKVSAYLHTQIWLKLTIFNGLITRRYLNNLQRTDETKEKQPDTLCCIHKAYYIRYKHLKNKNMPLDSKYLTKNRASSTSLYENFIKRVYKECF